ASGGLCSKEGYLPPVLFRLGVDSALGNARQRRYGLHPIPYASVGRLSNKRLLAKQQQCPSRCLHWLPTKHAINGDQKAAQAPIRQSALARLHTTRTCLALHGKRLT